MSHATSGVSHATASRSRATFGALKSRDTAVSTTVASITTPFHKLIRILGFRRLPFDAQNHPFVAANAANGDVRSPCPALNTMANHGYLPRNGRNICPIQLLRGLMQCFNLSFFLATFLTCGSLLLLGQWRMISLHDLCRHNGIEHSASLCRSDVRYYNHDVQDTDEFAPPDMDKDLWHKLEKDSADGEYLTVDDIARARLRREKESVVPLDPVHAHIARGEIGLVLDIFGGAQRKVPLTMLRDWWTTERFPEGWQPTRVQGFLRTGWTGTLVQRAMGQLRKTGQSF